MTFRSMHASSEAPRMLRVLHILRILHMLLSHRLGPAQTALSTPDAFTEVATQIVTEVPSAVGINVRLSFAGQLSSVMGHQLS